MNDIESIASYGTSVFSPETMRKLIGFGEPFFSPDGIFLGFSRHANPHNVSFVPWLEAMPEIYRKTAVDVIGGLQARWQGMIIRDDSIEKIIEDFLLVWDALFTRIENGELDDADTVRKTDEEGTAT